MFFSKFGNIYSSFFYSSSFSSYSLLGTIIGITSYNGKKTSSLCCTGCSIIFISSISSINLGTSIEGWLCSGLLILRNAWSWSEKYYSSHDSHKSRQMQIEHLYLVPTIGSAWHYLQTNPSWITVLIFWLKSKGTIGRSSWINSVYKV